MPELEEKKRAWLIRLGVTALPAAAVAATTISVAGDATGSDGSDGSDGGGYDGGTDGGSDGGSDGGYDGGTDGGSDGGYDGGTDGGSDGGYDGGTDGGSDGGYDGGTDGGSDGGYDGGTDGGSDGGYDGGTDGGTDGGSDGGTDGGSDGGSDGGTDGGYDGGYDGGTDGGTDGGSDGGTDGGYDGGTDGGYDGGTDGGYDGGTDGGYDGGSDGGYDGGTDGGYDGGADGGYDGGTDGGYDGGTDGGYDGGADGGYDGGTDGGYDGGTDGGYDGGTDGGYDGGTDGGYDGGTDGGYDGGADGGYDGGTDGGTDGGYDGGSDGGPYPSGAATATESDLFFDRDSSELTASDKQALTAYAQKYLAQSTPEKIHLDGYASDDGQKAHNQALSAARAKAAQDFLIGLGVAKANISATAKGPTTSFSKSDPGQNRRVTISPALKGGGGKPPPKPTGPPVLKHETEARSPTNRARTKLGVGERVTLSVTPGPGTWTVSKGKLSKTTGATVIFTADNRPGKAEITVTVGGQVEKVQFDVIAPNSVHMDVNGTRHMANGRPNGGIHTDVYVGPADVSFANIELLELEIGASAHGYWGALNGHGHGPNANFGPMTTTVASGKGTKFAFMDNCAIWGGGAGPPWAGDAVFHIPWQYRVVGAGGGGTTFATVTQSMVTTADGATTVSKAGASHTFGLGDGASSYPGAPF